MTSTLLEVLQAVRELQGGELQKVGSFSRNSSSFSRNSRLARNSSSSRLSRRGTPIAPSIYPVRGEAISYIDEAALREAAARATRVSIVIEGSIVNDDLDEEADSDSLSAEPALEEESCGQAEEATLEESGGQAELRAASSLAASETPPEKETDGETPLGEETGVENSLGKEAAGETLSETQQSQMEAQLDSVQAQQPAQLHPLSQPSPRPPPIELEVPSSPSRSPISPDKLRPSLSGEEKLRKGSLSGEVCAVHIGRAHRVCDSGRTLPDGFLLLP